MIKRAFKILRLFDRSGLYRRFGKMTGIYSDISKRASYSRRGYGLYLTVGVLVLGKEVRPVIILRKLCDERESV